MRRMIGLFKRRWTPWQPFGVYWHASAQFLVMARKNLRTGWIEFKSVRMNPRRWYNGELTNPIHGIDFINPAEQWKKLTE